jgi:hypothetical protein
MAMSQRERDVLKVMASVRHGQRTQVEAARLLALTQRQIRRLARRLACQGDRGVVHRLQGRPGNRRKDPDVNKMQIFDLPVSFYLTYVNGRVF